jgi:monofunctional biosynthetic peptidoglycan transglycosylase
MVSRYASGMMRNLLRPPRALMLVLAALVTLGGADLGLTWWRYRPAIAALAAQPPLETVYMRLRASAGQPTSPRIWTALGDVGSISMCAVLAAEDPSFFSHGTVDWGSQERLLRNVLRGDFSFGGSTIAQQLARNLFLGPQRTLRRKMREYVLAYVISHTLSKDRQLELYLNVVEWGPGIWGVSAASQHWFGKPPAALTPSEAVVLATLLPAPRLGLAYAATPAARQQYEWVVESLWKAALIDDVARRATAARLQRWADHVNAGRAAENAWGLVEQELGPENPVRQVGPEAGQASRTCDRGRRPPG